MDGRWAREIISAAVSHRKRRCRGANVAIRMRSSFSILLQDDFRVIDDIKKKLEIALAKTYLIKAGGA